MNFRIVLCNFFEKLVFANRQFFFSGLKVFQSERKDEYKKQTLILYRTKQHSEVAIFKYDFDIARRYSPPWGPDKRHFDDDKKKEKREKWMFKKTVGFKPTVSWTWGMRSTTVLQPPTGTDLSKSNDCLLNGRSITCTFKRFSKTLKNALHAEEQKSPNKLAISNMRSDQPDKLFLLAF